MKSFLDEKKTATGQVIAKHIIRSANEIPSSSGKSRLAQLLIIVHRLWKVRKMVEIRRESRMVGNRIILALL
jgi:hypothetical protein